MHVEWNLTVKNILLMAIFWLLATSIVAGSYSEAVQFGGKLGLIYELERGTSPADNLDKNVLKYFLDDGLKQIQNSPTLPSDEGFLKYFLEEDLNQPQSFQSKIKRLEVSLFARIPSDLIPALNMYYRTSNRLHGSFQYYNSSGLFQYYKSFQIFEIERILDDRTCRFADEYRSLITPYVVAFYQLAAYQKAGNLENSLAQYYLGLLYKYGFGVDRDYKAAIHWFTLAAEKNLAKAQFELGRMYQYVPEYKCEKKAFHWFEAAANQGVTEAHLELGMIYEEMGKEQDEKANRHFQLAAFQGSELAQVVLGRRYEEGIGVMRDIDEAIRFYTLAAEQGNDEATERLREIIGHMRERPIVQPPNEVDLNVNGTLLQIQNTQHVDTLSPRDQSILQLLKDYKNEIGIVMFGPRNKSQQHRLIGILAPQKIIQQVKTILNLEGHPDIPVNVL